MHCRAKMGLFSSISGHTISKERRIMDNATTHTAADAPSGSFYLSPINEIMNKCDQILHQHRAENPDLYRIIQLKKKNATTETPSEISSENHTKKVNTAAIATNVNSSFPKELRGPQLRARIQESHRKIHQRIVALDADIIPCTQAHNRKCEHQSIGEEREFRADVVAAQIRSWRSMLPNLIRRFSHIPDYRSVTRIKHKITVLMVFGLFTFIFRLNSRREMNRELTSPLILSHLKKLFPEIETIPHADTLARVLENINPKRIETIHISLIKELIKKKKFRKLLIQGCVPITIDGTQKLYRKGLLQDKKWCERKVGDENSDNKQQYIYVLEANITLRNGLTIPLMTEYLYRHNNVLEQANDKQDPETTAFERLSERLKRYFPRLKIILLANAMFATQPVMEILHESHWEYVIRLPKRKLTDFAKQLNSKKPTRISLPNKRYYRKRKQSFYWLTMRRVLSQNSLKPARVNHNMVSDQTGGMDMINFSGKHFPKDIILMGVRWYVAYPLSYRDIEELMAEHGVKVDHATVNRWVIEYSPQLESEFRKKYKRRIR